MQRDARGYNILAAVGSVLDYGFNWLAEGWLESGETITSSTWASSSISVTLDTPAIIDSVITSVIASGGTLGADIWITNTITTSEGREDSRSIILQFRKR